MTNCKHSHIEFLYINSRDMADRIMCLSCGYTSVDRHWWNGKELRLTSKFEMDNRHRDSFWYKKGSIQLIKFGEVIVSKK